MTKKAKIVQIKNPKTGLYIRINREVGLITGHKVSPGPYKGIPFSRRKTPTLQQRKNVKQCLQ